jgi:hypothetical protein
MNVVVAQASGEVLNYLIALIEKAPGDALIVQRGRPMIRRSWIGREDLFRCEFVSNMAQGGVIAERECHTLIKRDGVWQAECYGPDRFCYSCKGATMLEAALRTFAVSRLGYEVSVPEELV